MTDDLIKLKYCIRLKHSEDMPLKRPRKNCAFRDGDECSFHPATLRYCEANGIGISLKRTRFRCVLAPVTQTEEPDAFEAEMNMRIENIDKAINKGTPHKTYLEGEKSGFRYALAIYQELL